MSKLVLLLSSLFESSSKTLFLESNRCTIGEGWVGLRSKANLLTKDDVAVNGAEDVPLNDNKGVFVPPLTGVWWLARLPIGIGDPSTTPWVVAVTELLVTPCRGVIHVTAFEVGSKEGVAEAEGVADPVGVETPLGPDATDAAPLTTWGASIPAGILEEPDHFS